MALEVTFFFSSFLSLNLCMSLWFHCSHTAVQRQSYTKRWNEKAFWGDIESQVISTPGSSTELKCFFHSFELLPCFQMLWRMKTWRWRVKTQVQYGYESGLRNGRGGCDFVLLSVCRKERTLIWLLSPVEMGIVLAEWRAAYCSGFHFSSVWLKI